MNTISMALREKQFQSHPPYINNDGSLMQWKRKKKMTNQLFRASVKYHSFIAELQQYPFLVLPRLIKIKMTNQLVKASIKYHSIGELQQYPLKKKWKW